MLHIGRDDRGKVVGLRSAKELIESIPNKARDILGILVEVNLHEEDGKDYLEIVVEPYPYPISHKGKYYLRSGGTNQELKGATLDKFLLRKQGLHWDGMPVSFGGGLRRLAQAEDPVPGEGCQNQPESHWLCHENGHSKL